MSEIKNTTVDDSEAIDSTESTEVIQPDNKDAPTARPTVNFVNIPEELKNDCRFCLWKREKRKGGLTKVPYDPVTRNSAKSNDAHTFSDFNNAMKAYVIGGFEGIGIRVADGIGAIDIDHCIRPDGSLNDVAASILSIFADTYFERSPSGTGLRGFFRLDPDYIFDKTIYYINNRKLGLEVYLPGTTNRFVTVTGNCYRAGSVPLDMDSLQKVLDSFMKRPKPKSDPMKSFDHVSYLSDEAVIKHATGAKDGDGNPTDAALRFKAYIEGRWQEYYDNQSDADMSFISMLAFWCGCNEEQIDRIYRSSGMMRDKWDRKQSGTTYGAITIRNAVQSCNKVFTPIDIGADVDFADLGDGSGSSNCSGGSSTNSSNSGSDGSASQPSQVSSSDSSFTPDTSFVTASLEAMKPQATDRYKHGEIGLGNIFADYYREIARFNQERGVWYVFDGLIWRADIGGLAVSNLAKQLADALFLYALRITEENTRDDYIRRVKDLQFRRKRKTMVEDARDVYPLTMQDFDRDPYLFNCKNGTLDLRDFSFHKHNPKDYLTMSSPVVYDPEADCPRWKSFISEVMCGDEDTASYLQKALGYSLTGISNLECLFLLYGPTSRNGKGTTMETFLRVCGDYGKTSNPEMLSTKFNANTSGPSEEIARLAGVRFVNISEPEKNITFNAALVKRMTGNDTLNARFLHENSFDFRPVFKIFINTNYEPNVNDQTLFDSGRLKVIPFKRHFNDDEQDRGLKDFFAESKNLSGIFNWCLEGYKRFKSEGLEPPEAVKQATDSYKEDSDKIGQFVDDAIDVQADLEDKSSNIYRAYCVWCNENKYYIDNIRAFNKLFKKKFTFESKRPKAGGEKTSMYIGCKVNADYLRKSRGLVSASEDFDNTPVLT